jgi:hypothetical protein
MNLPEIEIISPSSDWSGGTGRIGNGPIEKRCYVCGRLKSEHIIKDNHPEPVLLERLSYIEELCKTLRSILVGNDLSEAEKVGYVVAVLILNFNELFRALKPGEVADHVRAVVPRMIVSLRD